MTPPASTVTKRGRYYIDTVHGGRYPSVTTVIDRALAKPALPPWYAAQTAARAVEHLAELSRRVRLDGADQAAAWLAAAPREVSGAAAVRGSDLHDLAERDAQGEAPPGDLDDDARAMLAHYRTFRADWSPVITHTEMTVLNRSLGYGGTADAVMSLPAYPGAALVVDYKTSRTGPYPEWAVQLAAYAAGECVLKKDPGPRGKIREYPMPAVDQARALILRVRPDGYGLYEADIAGLLDVFASMLEIAAFVERDDDLFTRLYPAHQTAAYWADRVTAAASVDDLTTIWIDACAASQWDDDLLAKCRMRKAQIIGVSQ